MATADTPKNPEGWAPPPLWAPLSGHLMVGVLRVPVIVVLLWLAMLVDWMRAAPVGNMVIAAAGAVIVGEVLATLAERPFVVTRRRSAPGGWDYALLPVVIHAVVGTGLGFLLLGGVRGGVALGVACAVSTVGEVILTKPWLPGDTQAQFDEKWRRTKEMTHELFDEDVREVKRRAAEKSRDRYYRNKRQ